MAADITSLFSSRDNMDYLVNLMMQQELRPRWVIQDKQDLYNTKKTTLSDLDSKLSALYSKLESINDSVYDYFAVKDATSSDTENFSVSAGSTAQNGNHSLTISRLASSDRRVSDQFTDTGTLLSSAISTAQTFSLEVAHPITGDESNRVTIDVTVSASSFDPGTTDADVLASIRDAIDTAMSNAVSAGTIESDEVLSASIVSESSGNSRLVLASSQSGYSNRMDFTDSTDLLLGNYLHISDNVQQSGTSGGWVVNPGSDATSNLNSNFILDGLTIYRDSNTVTDAVTGITINLLGTTVSEQTLTVNTDSASVKTDIQSFMDDFNSVIDFLKENARINPDTHVRGALSNDSTYSGLRSQLLGILSGQVSTGNTTYDRMADIGIGLDSNGKLSFIDSDKFTTALEANTEFVSKVFNDSTDGIATSLLDSVNNFTKTGGIIDNSKNQIDNTLVMLGDNLNRVEDQLAAKERRIRADLARMQDAMSALNNQSSYLSIFSSSF